MCNQLIWIYFDSIFAFVLKGHTKPFRDILILMLEVSQVLGDGHCIINCFSQHLNIVKSQILHEVWEEFDHRKGKYLSFSSYELEEELMKALEEYLFGKKYGHEVIHLLIDCLSTIHQLRVFIYEESLDSIPMGTIGEDYEKEIYLLKT